MSPPDWTVSSHGVRQLWPCEVRASAPGGSDSTRKTSVGAADFMKSRLGIDIEHAARANPHAATAITRLMVYPPLGRQRAASIPDLNLTGAPPSTQQMSHCSTPIATPPNP